MSRYFKQIISFSIVLLSLLTSGTMQCMFINALSKKPLLSLKPNNTKTIRQSYQKLAEEFLKKDQTSQDLKIKNGILNKCNDIDTAIAGVLNNSPERQKSARSLITLIENGYIFESSAQIAKHLIQNADDSQAEFDVDIEHGQTFNQRAWALHIFNALFEKGQAFKIGTHTAERLSNHEKWTKRRSALRLFSHLVECDQAIALATNTADKCASDSHYRIRQQAAYLFKDLVCMQYAYQIATNAAIKLCSDKNNNVQSAAVYLLKGLLDKNFAFEETKNIIVSGRLSTYSAQVLLDHLILSEKRLDKTKS